MAPGKNNMIIKPGDFNIEGAVKKIITPLVEDTLTFEKYDVDTG